MSNFTLSDWYWQLDDGRVWSSAKTAFVEANDADLLAWKSAGNTPVKAPDASGSASVQGLCETLEFYGLPSNGVTYGAARTALSKAYRSVVKGIRRNPG